MTKVLSSICFCVILMIGCTYSKKEVDYPVTPTSCDTTAARYSTNIADILNANCNSCHGGNASSGQGIVLDNYTDLKDFLDDTGSTLLNSIKHTGAASNMPKNAAKLSDCDISKIEAWISSGYPQN